MSNIASAKNTFLSGIMSDNSPLDVSNLAATDLINAETLSMQGNQNTLQPIPSNVPVVGKGKIAVYSFSSISLLDDSGNIVPTFDYSSTKIHISTWFSLGANSIVGFEELLFTVTYTDGTTDIVEFFEPQLVLDQLMLLTLNNVEDKIPLRVSWAVETGDTTGLKLNFEVTYSEIGNTGLPSENILLGLKTFNDVAYLISGKPLEINFKGSANNNIAITAKESMILGDVVDDRFESHSNILIDTSQQQFDSNIEYPIYKKSYGGRLVFQAVTYYTSNTIDNLVSVVRLAKAGYYVIDAVCFQKLDTGTSTFKTNTVDIQFWLIESTGARSISSVITVSDTLNSIAQKSQQLEFTSLEADSYIAVQYTSTIKDAGIVDVKGYLTLDFLEIPKTITETTLISVETLEAISSATTNQTTDGAIMVKKAGTGAYEVALENRVWEFVSDGDYHIFDGLASGSYTVYIKEGSNIIQESVQIAQKYTVPELEVIGQISDVTETEFKLTISGRDPDVSGPSYMSFLDAPENEYTIGYSFFGDNLQDGQVSSRELGAKEFIISRDGLTDDVLLVYVKATGNPYISGAETLLAEYGREAVLEIPIVDSLLDKKFGVEIGTFPSPEVPNATIGNLIPLYKPLANLDDGDFITDEISLTGDSYLEMEIQPSYDGSVNIIFSELGSMPRIVNSGFSVLSGSRYETVVHNSSNSTNKYYEKTVDLATRLIQSVSSVPQMQVEGVSNSGGCLPVGMYKYFVRLSTADGNETDILEESGYVPVSMGDTIGNLRGGYFGERTSKSVRISLSKVDAVYNHVVLYFIVNSGDDVNSTLAYRINKEYLIESTEDDLVSIKIVHTGYEQLETVALDSLSVKANYVASAKTLAQVQGRLFIGNLTNTTIDYNRLFQAGNRILTVPSRGSKDFSMSSVNSKWNGDFNSSLDNFSLQYFKQKITGDINIADINKVRGNYGKQGLVSTVTSQGFFNPLVAERLTGYWPLETYKTAVCWILDDNTVSNPVTTVAADYSAQDITKSQEILEASYATEFANIDFNSLSGNWDKGETGFNKLGVIRFPEATSPGVIYYPKFVFSRKELLHTYPEFFARVKGFFFVRAERSPDVVLSGAVLKCFNMSTELNPLSEFSDTNDYKEVPEFDDSTPSSRVSALPIPIFDDTTGGYSIIVGIEEFPDGTAGEPKDTLSGSGIRPKLTSANISRFIRDGQEYYKYAMYSGDLTSDVERAEANFNGTSFGIRSLSKFSYAVDLMEVAERQYNRLHRMNTSVVTALGEAMQSKAITDFIRYGKSARSAGGFASYIPYKSSRYLDSAEPVTKLKNKFPTGIFETFLGLTVDAELIGNFAMLYPNVDGPLSRSSIEQMYSSDESTLYVPITPRYTFEDFNNSDKIEVIGTRGDCFLSQNTFTIASSDVTTVGGPVSHRDTLQDFTTKEWNTYRAHEFSSSILLTHPSNYLAYARHPKSDDIVEAAQFGKLRGFLPLDGGGDTLMAKGPKNRIAETAGFNKGYKAHFEGRKYASTSKNTPYVSHADENTIMFSQASTKSSFYNGFRDFNVFNQKNYNKELGEITRIIGLNNNLITVHAKGITALQINESALLQNNAGSDLRIGSSSILPDRTTPVSTELGSRWRRSIVATDSGIYGVDVERHKVWFTSGNQQLTLISDGKVNRLLAGFLKGFAGQVEKPGELYIASSFDSQKNDVIITFYNKNSKFLSRAVEMDLGVYYMLYDMDIDSRDQWVDSAPMDTVKEERKKLLEQFNGILLHPEPVKHLTLVFNESSQTLTTRLSYSPEFMFRINNTLYSVNNHAIAEQFVDTVPIFSKDAGRQLIWEHGGTNKDIPTYGSFYGQPPVFELEFVVNQDEKRYKTFQELDIIGNDVAPDKVIYQLSEDAPWLNVLINTSDYLHQSDLDREHAYLDALLSGGYEGNMKIINPNTYIVQSILDRRRTSIMKANYSYMGGFGKIKVSKNLHTIYSYDEQGHLNERADKHMLQKLEDKYLRVRFVYNLGKYSYIKAVMTTFKY